MTTLIFLISLAAIFGLVLFVESGGEQSLRLQRPVGLLAWLTRGNWPAKVGGALIVVGLGALLRYALVNIDVAAEHKLASGFGLALTLGLASIFVPEGPARRPVSLALGGAAFGVAYLTAYSAFALFKYLSNPAGLALLGLTSVAAGVFAVTRSALSLAMLSMVGAYLAPAFATSDPGPTVVYGYYAGASLMTLAMVTLRGWHPLVHLSFLFTLAGGAFFGWTAQYYTATHAAVMQPMLLLLTAVHMVMPIVEKAKLRAPWMERLDVIYTLALPTVAALLAFSLSTTRVDFSEQLICLGVLWILGAVAMRVMARAGVAVHVVIAGVFLLFGLLVRFRDLPWELLLLTTSVAGLAFAAWRIKPATKLHSVLAGFVLLFGALHILNSTVSNVDTDTFFNVRFVERLLAAILLILAGSICRLIRQTLDTLLLAVGILWAVIAVGAELIQWQLATLALVVHGALVLVAGSLWIPGRRVRIADERVGLLSMAILATAAWASVQASEVSAWVCLIATPVALIGLAVRPLGSEGDTPNKRFVAALLAPVAAVIWANVAGEFAGIGAQQFEFALAVVFAMLALVAGRAVDHERGEWLASAVDIFGIGFAALLGGATLLAITRSSWAILLEFLCLAGLAMLIWLRDSRKQPTDLLVATCMIGLALILQANLMRLFGPAGNLDISDVLRLQWPAVVSLLWAIAGSALTIWSRQVGSRFLWIGGSTLLVAAAVKLLVVDFGSLGQLANILAVIAAGAVFLLVGWLAPMPTIAAAEKSSVDEDRESDADSAAQKKNAWVLAFVLLGASLLFYLHDGRRELFAHLRVSDVSRIVYETPPPEADLDGEALVAVQEANNVEEQVSAELGTTATEPRASSEAEVAPAPEPAATQTPPMPIADNVVPKPYVPPPTIDEHGVRTYTQYSYPQPVSAHSASEPPAPAAGQAGLDQLLREGRLRRATSQDMDRWLAATGSRREALLFNMNDPASGGRYMYRTYVVVREMTFPPGLNGAHAAVFLIPRNVPRPYGTAGHSQVLEYP